MMKIFYVLLAVSSLLSIDLKADPLRDLANCYCDHMEEEYELRSSYAKQVPTQNNEASAEAAQQNLTCAIQLRDDVQDYLNDIMTPDNLLSHILFSRFHFLQTRSQNYLSAKQELKMTGTLQRMFLATRPDAVEIFRKKADDYPNDPVSVGNYNSVLNLIDMYQIQSKIIVEVFNRHSLDTFSKDTLNLLRASVTLHPLLRGESDNWRHPDYAFLTQVDEPKHLFGKRDMDYYIDFVEVSEQTVQLMNWTRSYIQINATNAEVGKATLELPPLSSLRKVAEIAKLVEIPTHAVEMSSEKENPEKKVKKGKKNKKDVRPIKTRSEKSLEPVTQGLMPNVSEDIKQEQVPLVLELTPPMKSDLPLSDVKNVAPKSTKTSEKKIPNAKQNLLVKVDEEKDILVPRGNRLFHNQRPLGTLAPTILPNHLQGTVDSLFHHQQYQTVSFGEFASVWRHVNGANSIKSPGSGGSHRALLNAQGQVIGSTFTHGDKQTYGPKTVKYLRDALLQVGATPSQRKKN